MLTGQLLAQPIREVRRSAVGDSQTANLARIGVHVHQHDQRSMDRLRSARGLNLEQLQAAGAHRRRRRRSIRLMSPRSKVGPDPHGPIERSAGWVAYSDFLRPAAGARDTRGRAARPWYSTERALTLVHHPFVRRRCGSSRPPLTPVPPLCPPSSARRPQRPKRSR
jgi:hypothetical protein